MSHCTLWGLHAVSEGELCNKLHLSSLDPTHLCLADPTSYTYLRSMINPEDFDPKLKYLNFRIFTSSCSLNTHYALYCLHLIRPNTFDEQPHILFKFTYFLAQQTQRCAMRLAILHGQGIWTQTQALEFVARLDKFNNSTLLS